jgi:hypothetical protein
MDEKLDLELLRAYEPELRLADGERFWPTAVESYVRQCSLRVELRLFGPFRTHAPIPIEGGLDATSLHSCVDGEDDPAPDLSELAPRWRRIIQKWPFLISRRYYLRYVQPLQPQTGRDSAGDDSGGVASKAQHKPDPDPGDSTAKGKWGAVGCLFVLAAVTVLLFETLFKPPLPTWVLLGVGLLFWALSSAFIKDARKLGIALIYLGYVSITLAILLWIKSIFLIVAFVVLFVFYVVAYFISSMSYRVGDWVDLISSLDKGTADRAHLRFTQEKDARCDKHPYPCYHYYGRVYRPERPSQWRSVLQYWFFYPMNDWRSEYGGVNDHEGDWEGLQVFLPQDKSRRVQVAYSQHLGNKVEALFGRHPVVYVGAGSHANYPNPGEHTLLEMILDTLLGNTRAMALAIVTVLESVALTFVEPPQDLRAGGLAIKSLDGWRDLSRQFIAGKQASVREKVPQVMDQATGDGTKIQPGQWTRTLIKDSTPWVQFDGLWGRKVGFDGESGPGGPMYLQNGQVRPAWDDPIKWAGLSP